jgi:hypothetical protein
MNKINSHVFKFSLFIHVNLKLINMFVFFYIFELKKIKFLLLNWFFLFFNIRFNSFFFSYYTQYYKTKNRFIFKYYIHFFLNFFFLIYFFFFFKFFFFTLDARNFFLTEMSILWLLIWINKCRNLLFILNSNL